MPWALGDAVPPGSIGACRHHPGGVAAYSARVQSARSEVAARELIGFVRFNADVGMSIWNAEVSR